MKTPLDTILEECGSTRSRLRPTDPDTLESLALLAISNLAFAAVPPAHDGITMACIGRAEAFIARMRELIAMGDGTGNPPSAEE